ncbi:MAG: hypothetical protein A2Y40_10765 [Candidatus Margulisbacteria bacterium GWF2_35_9]|nr:MAG: hypothetical protein A2Y40_10765 [Candidatus Margulisbacteria bacterium GWF2_35_9]
MKKVMFLLIVVVLAGIVFAAEPFINPSGLISAPQAYMPNQGTMQIAYNSAAFFTEKSKWTTKYNENQSNFAIFYSPFQNLQLGLSSVIDVNQASTYGLDMKYQLYDERGSMPAVAIGASQFGNTAQQTVYIVASKQFGKDTRMSLGIGNGGYLGNGQVTGFFNGAVFGIEQTMFGIPFIAEFAGDSFNAGARIRLNEKMTLNLALCELENTQAGNTKEPRFVIGFTIEEPFENRVVLNDIYSESHGYASKEISSDKYKAVFTDVKKPMLVAQVPAPEQTPPVVQAPVQAPVQSQASKEQLKKIEDSIADLKKETAATQTQLNSKIAKLEQEKVEINKLVTESDLKNKVVVMNNDINDIKKSIMVSKKNDTSQSVQILNNKVAALNNEITVLKSSLNQVSEKTQKNEEVAMINDKIENLSKKMDEMNANLLLQEEKKETFYQKVLRKLGISQ